MTIEQCRENFFTMYSEAMAVYGVVDRVAKEVVQLVNGSGEHRIACRRGCNTCCTVFVRVTFAEAAAIAQWLSDWSNPGARPFSRENRQVAQGRGTGG